MKLFRVVKPGFFTTVQDLGRQGYLRYGVPVSGAMDEFSLQLANMLVGNDADAACLEVTLIGPELEALGNTQIAVTGADIRPKINGQECDMWQTLAINEGDTISFERCRAGCRAYVSVAGGIDVPLVLGSRSTYTRCAMGGHQGRQLRAEDIITGSNSPRSSSLRLSVPSSFVPTFKNEIDVKVVLGSQQEFFSKSGFDVFLSSPYTITTEADRMGYRLEGPSVEHSPHGDTISDAVIPGAVQVPASGKPIVTMKDAQTTGGYPKIALVISSDLDTLGQAKPNDVVRFHETTLREAHQRLFERRRQQQHIQKELQKQAF